MTIDSAWRDAFAKGLRTQTAESLLTNDFSLKLRQIKKNNPVVGELMLTSASGVLIAASDYTSDYWQGDEEKITSLDNSHFYLSDIKYDESTRKFVAHYSRKLDGIKESEESDESAILIVGILLEDLLIETFLF